MNAALEQFARSAIGKALIVFAWAFGTWLTFHYTIKVI